MTIYISNLWEILREFLNNHHIECRSKFLGNDNIATFLYQQHKINHSPIQNNEQLHILIIYESYIQLEFYDYKNLLNISEIFQLSDPEIFNKILIKLQNEEKICSCNE